MDSNDNGDKMVQAMVKRNVYSSVHDREDGYGVQEMAERIDTESVLRLVKMMAKMIVTIII